MSGDHPLPPCPTPCDPDCDTDCDEEHLVPWKRGHQPHGCHEIRVAIAGWVTAEREGLAAEFDRQAVVTTEEAAAHFANGDDDAGYAADGASDTWRAAASRARRGAVPQEPQS